MIIEMRSYTLHGGATPAYLSVYQSEGMDIQLHHLPRLLGSFTSDIGPLNQVVCLWGYEDLAERARCRAALAQDALWRPYVEKIRGFIQAQESRILSPTSFSPMH